MSMEASPVLLMAPALHGCTVHGGAAPDVARVAWPQSAATHAGTNRSEDSAGALLVYWAGCGT
jgi:hypothetical protein